MRLLVLGGTVFLSRTVAVHAAARGHDVTVACRARSGTVPDGVRHLPLDRAAATPREVAAALAGHDGPGFDAVVDVARVPSWVRSAVAATRAAHWVFVSTISVYPDTRTPGAAAGDLPLHDPEWRNRDPAEGPEVYGAMKVACEQLVRSGTASCTLVRPGLVVGPGDPSGRFTYWPRRLDPRAEHADHPVLAPGSPEDPTQVVDVRDLASWCVDLAARRDPGTYDAIGRSIGRGDLLAAVAEGCGSDPDLTWVGQAELRARGVEPWSGPRSLPLWLPLPDFAGMLAHDHRPAQRAGLRCRRIADTAADTLAWSRDAEAHGDGPAVTGLTRDEESAVLAAG